MASSGSYNNRVKATFSDWTPLRAVMCGISAVLSAPSEADVPQTSALQHVDALSSRLRESLTNRGPDVQNEVSVDLSDYHAVDSSNAGDVSDTKHAALWLFGSVLHIQGEAPAMQPYRDVAGKSCL
jgi:asparagine synthetase B (glutamine-hydrolysing)